MRQLVEILCTKQTINILDNRGLTQNISPLLKEMQVNLKS